MSQFCMRQFLCLNHYIALTTVMSSFLPKIGEEGAELNDRFSITPTLWRGLGQVAIRGLFSLENSKVQYLVSSQLR